jgi:hypothetical protein
MTCTKVAFNTLRHAFSVSGRSGVLLAVIETVWFHPIAVVIGDIVSPRQR